MNVIKEYSIDIGGKTLTAQFTDLAERASGSCLMRYGETVILATAIMSDSARDGQNWFPLTVDYEERFYAAGEILGSRFVRREGRPTDEAVLSARVVDRTIRPLFNQKIRNEVQIVITVLSIGEDDPDILAVNAASLALATSNVPWDGPVGAVRVGKHGDKDSLEINPTYLYRNDSLETLDMIVCGKGGKINMIEVGADQKEESVIAMALEKASIEITKMEEWQKKIVSDMGQEKRSAETAEIKEEAEKLFEEKIAPKLGSAVFSSSSGESSIDELRGEWRELFKESFPDDSYSPADLYFEEKVDEEVHRGAIEEGRRADGRKMEELRPLYAKTAGISNLVHGSGTFYRGGTHILSVLTLGGPEDSQLLEGMEIREKKRFFHHYNFPPFSVGETGRVGGFNRRQIGHGALAEKAISYILPSKEKFPYTMRIVSEVMASNGSSSMGSVCGSTLALMDGGVPIKAPVAGIAMGLMMELFDSAQSDAPRYKILTDIQGPEDHYGDMDFKVAGTRKGVTAIQMDVKVSGVPIPVLSEALEAARLARLQILDVMEKEIPAPRPNISPNAPEIIIIMIDPKKIGLVIGSGGKTINDIKERTGAEITIEDDGSVYITGKNGSAEKAREIIEAMTKEFKAGDRIDGEVATITDFGAFVKLNAYADGLVHISEVAPFRINKVSDYLKVGDKVPVVVKEVDERGRVALSIKAVNPEFFKEKK